MTNYINSIKRGFEASTLGQALDEVVYWLDQSDETPVELKAYYFPANDDTKWEIVLTTEPRLQSGKLVD